MINDSMGIGAVTADLRRGLTSSMERTRAGADRIANAFNGSEASFTDALDAARNGSAAGEPVDIEAEMIHLADEQIRFDAMSRMLAKVYQQVRSSVRGG
jgi:flagellar basal body rod protein FlgB